MYLCCKLTPGLDHFQKGPHSELDTLLIVSPDLVGVVLLEEFSDSFTTPADGISLPLVICSRRVGLEQMR